MSDKNDNFILYNNMPKKLSSFFLVGSLLITILALNSCSLPDGLDIKNKPPITRDGNHYQSEKELPVKGKLFGDLRIQDGKFVGNQKKVDGSGIGVNAHLWRATVETLSFMQIEKADPFSGIITTGWYYPQSAKNERIKINAVITDKKLHANALKISIIKEVKRGSSWKSAKASDEAEEQLELSILNRARIIKSGGAYDDS